MKKDKITIYYWGDINNVDYNCTVTTVQTFNKWKQERSAKVKGIAFILPGTHGKLKSIELYSYMKRNNLEFVSI